MEQVPNLFIYQSNASEIRRSLQRTLSIITLLTLRWIAKIVLHILQSQTRCILVRVILMDEVLTQKTLHLFPPSRRDGVVLLIIISSSTIYGQIQKWKCLGHIHEIILQVCFCISIDSKLGQLKKMMPPLFKKNCLNKKLFPLQTNCYRFFG